MVDFLKALAIVMFVIAGTAMAAAPAKSWIAAGSAPKDYDMGVDKKTELHNGKPSAFLISNKPKTGGFGTFMQMCKPAQYAGKRVRFSAYVKCADVGTWAGLWFRVDGEGGKQLGFDNMMDRPIKGTLDWKQYSCVLDVPKDAEYIAYGILLDDTGKTWMSDVKLDVVGDDVPVTNMKMGSDYPSAPENLDFSQD